jgi:hypothetical protein
MNDVKGCVHRPACKIGKEELIEEAGPKEESGNPVKSDLLFSLKSPPLGKDMDVMI